MDDPLAGIEEPPKGNFAFGCHQRFEFHLKPAD
jgi:hypothetical protein